MQLRSQTELFTASAPLAEGPNILTATATSPSGSVGSASITVTPDTTPPHFTITSPADRFVTTDSTISIAGNVNDTVVGTVNSQQAQVKVNNLSAQVANRAFLATNVPLNMGSTPSRPLRLITPQFRNKRKSQWSARHPRQDRFN